MQLHVPQPTVWRVLQTDHQHPYHFTPVQELLAADIVQRAQFCRDLLRRDEEDPDFLKAILWTDESQFTRDGVTNFHNLHAWEHENPHHKKPASFQRRFSVNVWAGIIENTFIGPVYLPPVINGENYLQFLNNAPFDDDIPIGLRNRVVYQQDGAPAHFTLAVRQWLNERYPGRWIGRGGPIAWPPRSPDLTPLDFYVWGYLKAEVYQVPIDTREQLIERIESACEKIKENLRTFNMCTAIKRRLELCLIQNGDHIENFL